MSRIEKLLEFWKLHRQTVSCMPCRNISRKGTIHGPGTFETILEREPGYIGSYYHLGKLRQPGRPDQAILIYERGNGTGSRKKRQSQLQLELQGALEDLEDQQ